MDRREFLGAAGLGLAGLAVPQSRSRPPNILFCIADDWGWPHAGAYGDRVVRTPVFDRIARDGALFTRAYCAAPSCTPSRAGILTGQMPHRLAEGANLWGFLPRRFAVYPDLLEAAGYAVGLKGKGWGPGREQEGGWTRNPAGPLRADFVSFLAGIPADQPFCYWFGSSDPHREYDSGSGARSGLNPGDVQVPPWLPDNADVRSDILDYYFEVARFDSEVGRHLEALAVAGRADHTIVVVTSDNGWPFPRGKANLYDYGTHMPLAIRWQGMVRPGTRVDAFVSLTDLAPTFLEAAGLDVPGAMARRSLIPLLFGNVSRGRDTVFTERERHANVRRGDVGYPSRAVRTERHLYIRNFRPDRWPAGDPELWMAVGPFGDIDNGPTKTSVVGGQGTAAGSSFFDLACAKRPAEELYDLRRDPHEMHNVAADPAHRRALNEMRGRLEAWMRATRDPRVDPRDERFESYPYFGGPAAKR